MNLDPLAAAIDAAVLEGPARPARPVARVQAGDRMSDLLYAADDETLIVTHLATAGLVRLIELMDVPVICVVGGARPESAVIAAAAEHGATVMVSPHPMFETCGRLHRVLCPGGNDA